MDMGYLKESQRIVKEQAGGGKPLKIEIDEAAGFGAEAEAFATGAKTTE